MTVKYSALKSLLKHSAEFVQETQAFIASIEKELPCSLVDSDLADYDCDLKLLFVQTGGSENVFLSNLANLKPPFYLLTNGGNNSLAASLEILTYAQQNGYEGEILHGSPRHVANRIADLVATGEIKSKIRGINLGVIGTPSDWLIASVPSSQAVKKLNINLKYLPLSEVEKGLDTQDTFGKDEKELAKANLIYENLKGLVQKHNLSGLTLRCFDLLPSVKMTGCLALAKLNQEGIVATCEGDIAAMISMQLVRTLYNLPTFQANPSQIDCENNEIVFAHCTVPLDMLEDYSLTTHFESGIGVAVKGTMKKLPVTVFRMSASLDRFTILQGEIVENLNEKNLCRTQIKIKCQDDVSALLKQPCGNHHVIFYGHYKQDLQRKLNLLLNDN